MALVNDGEEVIIPAPYWVSYPQMVKLAGGEPIIVNAGFEQNFKMTPEQLEALKSQIKAKESTVDSEAEEVNAEDTVEDVENVEDAEVVEEDTKEE